MASHGTYGAPRIFLDLREAGETCSTHRVARLMREAKLRALHGYRTRRWSVGKPSVLIPNLVQRRFTVFSRRIVGWAAEPTLHRELVLNAVLMAVRGRRARRTIIHSDQGTQFGCDAWRRFCRSHLLEPSMGLPQIAAGAAESLRSLERLEPNGAPPPGEPASWPGAARLD